MQDIELLSEPSEQRVEEYTTIEELLISCVQARPPLWDCRLPLSCRSKTARDQLWFEIFAEFGENPEFSINFLQKKWRNLRDTYVRLKGKYSPSGSAAKKKKKWEYFDLLSFLNDTIGYRQTVSNIGSESISSRTTPLDRPANSTATAPVVRGSQANVKNKNQNTCVEEAIIDALARVSESSSSNESAITQINPICARISDILYKMPEKERTLLEIKLLQMAYEDAKNFL